MTTSNKFARHKEKFEALRRRELILKYELENKRKQVEIKREQRRKHGILYRREQRHEREAERKKQIARNIGILIVKTLSKAGLKARVHTNTSARTGIAYMKVHILGPDGQKIMDSGSSIKLDKSGIYVAFSTWDIINDTEHTARVIRHRLRKKGGVE